MASQFYNPIYKEETKTKVTYTARETIPGSSIIYYRGNWRSLKRARQEMQNLEPVRDNGTRELIQITTVTTTERTIETIPS